MFLKNLQILCESNTLTFPLHSRVHSMKEGGLFVKREDELGFGISGSKLRKYVSILPVLEKQKKRVALVGSLYSNHILSFLQLLKQEGISYQLFLEKPKSKERKGNAFFLSLLIEEKEVVWLEKAPEILECQWIKGWEEILQEEFFWIPLGGCMKESLVGSLSLALDIIKNEKELGLIFDHIFVDAGTGMSAIALILGMSYLRKNVQVHVVLMAGKEIEFSLKLRSFQSDLEKLLKEPITLISYRCLFPFTAKSFGSHNASIFKMIKETAEKEGFFLDPLYTAKLLMTTKKVVKEESLRGNILWIHSGGALSLSGFQSYFSPFTT